MASKDRRSSLECQVPVIWNYQKISKRFYVWCSALVSSERPYFLLILKMSLLFRICTFVKATAGFAEKTPVRWHWSWVSQPVKGERSSRRAACQSAQCIYCCIVMGPIGTYWMYPLGGKSPYFWSPLSQHSRPVKRTGLCKVYVYFTVNV